MRKIVLFFLASFLIISCSVRQPAAVQAGESQDPLLLSVLWFQKSAEMKALFIQGYNIAQKSLDEKLAKKENSKQGIIIMDIDETVLDNSPSEVYLIRNGVPFSDEIWKKWVKMASAKACPGALEFVRYAQSKNIEVFYVTNRETPDELEPTIKNLTALGFPYADNAHLILKAGISSKEQRRQALAEKYDILMLIGDNLADFNVAFDIRGADLGAGEVEKQRQKFGTDYIILPNPMYGPWINAAVREKPGDTNREKIMNSLEGF